MPAKREIQVVRRQIEESVKAILAEATIKRRNDPKGEIDVILKGSQQWVYNVKLIKQIPITDLEVGDPCLVAKFENRWFCVGTFSAKAHVALMEEHVMRHGASGSDTIIEIGATEPTRTFAGKLWLDTSA